MLTACADAPGNRRNLRQVSEILLGRDSRQRDVETEIGEDSRAVERVVECAGAADRIIRLWTGAIDGHLKLDLLAVESRQELSNAAGEQRRIRQHNQFAAVRLGDVPGEIENVTPEERLAAGDVETLGA